MELVRFRFGLKIKEGIDIENKVNDLIKDLPQLIVALDSLDDSANYIHISDANYETTYYCPCCKGVVKPRACKEDVDYQVQPHFYHENGGCSEESFVHYICKTWLFEKGSKFKIKNNIYTVNNIETEKTFHTQFGDYRPDIVVETEENKTYFFEIKYSNKKTEHYIPKWDELENDVVEVDAREFINQKHNNDVPEFKLIYSDGECFIKSYSRHDYEDTIAKRKIEWKRQDKLNYKIQWERLDWFWNTLQDYIEEKCVIDTVLQKFKEVGYDNIEICWDIVSKMSCLKNLKQEFRNIVNNIVNERFFKDLLSYKKECEGYFIIYDDQSHCRPREGVYISFNDCKHKHWNECVHIQTKKWVILPSDISKVFDKLKNKINQRICEFNKDIHIKEYVTEEKFPLFFYDEGIEWDSCEIPRKANINFDNIIPTEEYDYEMIDKIINDYYESVKIDCKKTGVRSFTLDKIIDYVYKYLCDKELMRNFEIIKNFYDNSISLVFCGDKYTNIKFNGFYVEIDNFRLEYSGLKISEISNRIFNYCEELSKSISTSFTEMINDIIAQGNRNYWKMTCDYATYEIFIEFTYSYKYLNDYLKRNILRYSFNLNAITNTSATISLENYAETRNHITKYLASQMYMMLKNEVDNFKKLHEAYGICIIDKGGNIIE